MIKYSTIELHDPDEVRRRRQGGEGRRCFIISSLDYEQSLRIIVFAELSLIVE